MKPLYIATNYFFVFVPHLSSELSVETNIKILIEHRVYMRADYLFIHLHATFVDAIWPLISRTISVTILDQQKTQVSTSWLHGSGIKK